MNESRFKNREEYERWKAGGASPEIQAGPGPSPAKSSGLLARWRTLPMWAKVLIIVFGLGLIGSLTTPYRETKRQSVGTLNKSFEIVSIDQRVTETNSVWWRHAWKLTLRNLGNVPIQVNALIEFQDSDGFIVDSARAYNLIVPAGAEKTFTGDKLITASVAQNVDQIVAKVNSSQ